MYGLYFDIHFTETKSFKSFKSLFHNTTGKNGSQYTVNKLTYIHSLYINKYNDI